MDIISSDLSTDRTHRETLGNRPCIMSGATTPATTSTITPATLLMPGFLFSGIVIWGCDDPGDAISRGNGPKVSGPASDLFGCSESTKPEHAKEDRIQHGQVKLPPFQRVHARRLKPEQQDGLDQEMPGYRDAADPFHEGSPAGNKHGSARCLNSVDAGLQTVRILDNPGQHGGEIKFFFDHRGRDVQPVERRLGRHQSGC